MDFLFFEKPFQIHKTKRKSIHASFFFYLSFIIALPIIFTSYIFLTSFYNNTIFDFILIFTYAWSIFFALFKLTVNRYVSTKAALISSLVTLIIIGITKNLFVYYVLYNQTYTTIYGSMATLLFTFLWIYISWIIYLYGIKMCHRLNLQELLKERHN